MQVKSVITISEDEQNAIDTVYNLIDDIDRNDIAKATIYNNILKDYKLTLGDIKSLLYAIDKIVIIED